MRPGQARFVTACQQLLALAAVLAVLTPAASVISLDVVSGGHSVTAREPRTTLARTESARVPTAVVDPVVKEYALTPAPGQRSLGKTAVAPVLQRRAGGATELLSPVVPVTGFGAVGVTWSHGDAVPAADATFQVRTRTGTVWSGWSTLPYDPDHAPDPTSREGQHARPGTDPVLVGKVDQVQIREHTTAALPTDMKLAVIDPGEDGVTRTERPAIDTATLDEPSLAAPSRTTVGDPVDASTKVDTGSLALEASTYTPKPQIFSRAQWGADESMRDPSSLHYFEVHAGFVHHTVNANDYTRAEVPALIRSIYAYHVRSRGWSDIGYNFLVDRFGRIWEGRYGGVDRPVVGAHTLGYNDYSFAMSAIGNYELVKPSDAVLRAYGRLFAWKLSLHGVDAASTSQQVGPTVFQAINGHRDAASTACPGKYLYARLPTIRALAAADQQGWSGRERMTDLASTPNPDLVMRRAGDGRVFVVPTGGLMGFGQAAQVSTGWTADETIIATPDVTGDGRADLAVRDAGGTLRIYPGDGHGGFGNPVKPTGLFAGLDQIAAAGDVNEDGHNDLVARDPASGRLVSFLGRGHGDFSKHVLGLGWQYYRSVAGAGDLNGDGHVDLAVLNTDGRLQLRKGLGTGRFGRPVALPGDYSSYGTIAGYGDFTHDGRPDLLARVSTTGSTVVLPALGTGYGHADGPFARLQGIASLSGANFTGTAESDAIGRHGGALTVAANSGTFDLGTPIDTGLNLQTANAVLNVGDWDRDGHGDLVARYPATGNVYLFRGDGTGHFASGVRIAEGFKTVRLLAAVGDMTGDGYPDLMGQPIGQDMRIYPGAGLAGLHPSYVAYGSIVAARQIGAGRWDTDGAPDSLMRQGNYLRLYPGNGPGGLVSNVRTLGVDLKPYDWVLGVGDVDGSGHADLLVREHATGDLWLLPGTSRGFGARHFLGSGFGGYNLAD